MKVTLLPIKDSISCPPLRSVFVFIALFGFALSPTQAVSPAPDGGYLNGNTAEGNFALQNLTTGNSNTALGNGALFSDTIGSQNTATGRGALFHNTTGFQNVAAGIDALFSNTTGFHNTAVGIGALFSNTTGNHNTANGDLALISNTTGNFNTVDGAHALISNTTGDLNIALGLAAGESLTTGSNNIDISNGGVAADSNIIRIGNEVPFTDLDGIVHPAHTKTFIAGVTGATAVGGAAVFVDSSGQLGTMTSSARFKDEIKPMDNASEAIFGLEPVTFRYKKEIDPKGMLQFGLVAEEVAKVNPDLVVRDRNGKPYTVRYEAVNAMLLSEFLKEHHRVKAQQRQIIALKSRVAKQETLVAEQQKQLQATVAREEKEIGALTSSLKEQAAQIQKVSAQIEMNVPATKLAGASQ
jgi:hypothetical protein